MHVCKRHICDKNLWFTVLHTDDRPKSRQRRQRRQRVTAYPVTVQSLSRGMNNTKVLVLKIDTPFPRGIRGVFILNRTLFLIYIYFMPAWSLCKSENIFALSANIMIFLFFLRICILAVYSTLYGVLHKHIIFLCVYVYVLFFVFAATRSQADLKGQKKKRSYKIWSLVLAILFRWYSR